jgi:DNA-binding NarL/FixJ family response regulator
MAWTSIMTSRLSPTSRPPLSRTTFQVRPKSLRLARRLRHDLVLMDLAMPGLDGVEATRAIRRELPETEVLTLTSVLEDRAVVGAVRAEAIDYLLKDVHAAELRRAIKAAAVGQVQLAPEAAARLLSEPART